MIQRLVSEQGRGPARQPVTEVSSEPGRRSLDAASSVILNWPSWIHRHYKSPLGLQPSLSAPSYVRGGQPSVSQAGGRCLGS